MSTTHPVTIRLPAPVYRRAKEQAESRGISLAAFAREAIADKARSSARQFSLAAAYESLASDPAETDVEPFFAAHAETLGG